MPMVGQAYVLQMSNSFEFIVLLPSWITICAGSVILYIILHMHQHHIVHVHQKGGGLMMLLASLTTSHTHHSRHSTALVLIQ